MTKAELLGLKWSDIDFENQTIYVNCTLVYVTCKDEISPKYGKKINEFHEPKTEKGKCKIPMTLKAYQILKNKNSGKRKSKPKERKRRRDLKTWYLLLQGMLPGCRPIMTDGVISNNQLHKFLFAPVAKNREMLVLLCEEHCDSRQAFEKKIPQLTFQKQNSNITQIMECYSPFIKTIQIVINSICPADAEQSAASSN